MESRRVREECRGNSRGAGWAKAQNQVYLAFDSDKRTAQLPKLLHIWRDGKNQTRPSNHPTHLDWISGSLRGGLYKNSGMALERVG